MHTIIQCQKSQYLVKAGDVIVVDKLPQDVGHEFTSTEVLLIKNDAGEVSVGQPFVSGAQYKAKILKQFKDKKVTVFKKKRRHNYRRKRGHRQQLTQLAITEINY